MAEFNIVTKYEGIYQLPHVLLAVIAGDRAFEEFLSDFSEFSLNYGLFLVFGLTVADVADEEGESSDCNRLLSLIHNNLI